MQGKPRRAGHAETDHGENLGGIAERPVLCGVGAGEIELTGGPSLSAKAWALAGGLGAWLSECGGG